MVCHDETDPNWPSISELIVLVSWMLAGMKSQKRGASSKRTQRHNPFHHTFPVRLNFADIFLRMESD